jgi:hypothetical protein
MGGTPMRSIDYTQSTYQLVIEPHVEIAIWAIIVALACVLVIFIDGMVKTRNEAASRHRDLPKRPGRKR